jgi:uncharacterized protein (TIGR02231 family)
MTSTILSLMLLFGGISSEVPLQEVPSEIKAVTVYLNGASVTRQAELSLKSGKHTLLFNNLTPNLIPATIQLGANGRYTLLSLKHSNNYFEEITENDSTRALEKRKMELEEKLNRNQAALDVEQRRQDFLNPARLINEKEKYSTSELQAFLEFFSQQSLQIQNKMLDLKIERGHIQEELQKVMRQLNEIRKTVRRNTSQIVVEIESPVDQTLNFELNYLINGARWTPEYDIRAGKTDEPVQLVYKASIYQNSGFDWNEVELSVSSANPQENTMKPVLNPWFVDFMRVEPMPIREQAAGMNARSKVSEEAADAYAEVMVTASEPIAELNRNVTSFTYTINRPYTVQSGNNAVTAIISGNELDASFSYAAVPSRSSKAFLLARIGGWGDLNLLSGYGSLYFENTYVGKSYINPSSVLDSLDFSLGTDKSIVIERKQLRDFEERVFFGSRTRESKVFEISVRNTKSEPIEIEIQDQIPVAMDESIKISPKELDRAVYDAKTGFLTWKLNIPAGESRNIRFSYQLEYPKGKQLDM